MPVLTVKIFVIILAALSVIHFIGDWVTRRKRQKRGVVLKQWIDKQDKSAKVIYREVPIRLAHPRESN